MDVKVAIVDTRPETALQDLRRVMHLADLGAGPDGLDGAAAVLVAEGGEAWLRPGRGSSPWQVAGVAGALLGGRRHAAQVRVISDAPAAMRAAHWREPLRGLQVAPPGAGDEPLAADEVPVLLPSLGLDARWGLRGAAALAQRTGLLERGRRPLGAVLDATVCDVGPGAMALNVLIAGGDAVAVDAVAARMLGRDPLSVPWLRRCHQRGEGCADLASIAVMGDAAARVLRIEVPWPAPAAAAPAPLRRLAGPLGGFYRRWLWYPSQGRRRWRRYLATPWGRLHEALARGDEPTGEMS